ncbi:MAG: methyltransferase domain-containing protein [Candidatus Eisenbacteria bacterium]|nr:methyltransferase domain-containing protein [Candidatus Eisenbacteria bacterium]
MEAGYHLDPVMARHKRKVHLDLLREWCPATAGERVLKTDLFEEALAEDRILPDWPDPEGDARVFGVDIAPRIAAGAARRLGGRRSRPVHVAAGDALRLPFRDGAFDVVYSCSTLDHFPERAALLRGIAEAARVLRPGGRLIVALDNPEALFHPLARLFDRLGVLRFRLGETLSGERLEEELARLGLRVLDRRNIFHVPRVWCSALLGALRVLRIPADRFAGDRLERMERAGRKRKGRRTAWYVAALARLPEEKDETAGESR